MNNRTRRDEFTKWANNSGYDIASYHDGAIACFLNPMTRDLWAAWQASRQAIGAQEPVAWLVEGRIENGLAFDKTDAEKMAEANCGTVRALVVRDDAAAIEQRGYERGLAEAKP